MALTPEQFQKLQARLSGGRIVPTTTTPVAPTPAAPSFSSNVKDAFNKRVSNVEQVADKYGAGKTGILGGALQTVGQSVGFIGDAAFEGAKALAPQPLEDAIGAGLGAVAGTKPVQDLAAGYTSWKNAHPEAAANLEAVVNIGSIIPAGKGAQLAGKAGSQASGAAISATGSTIAGAGRAFKGAGRVINNSAFTNTVQDAERLINYKAQTPFLSRLGNTLSGTTPPNRPRTVGDTALERGIAGFEGGIGVQAKRQSSALWNTEIAPAVRASGATMTKNELFAPAREAIEQTVDPTRKKALMSAYEALVEDYADFADEFSLETAQALKRDVAKFIPSKMYRGQDVASEVKTLQFTMADAIRQKTYNALADEGIRAKYLDYANLDALEEVGVKALSEAAFKGGSGKLISGLWDALTTPIKTVGGQVLYRVGNAFEFVGDKGIKRFGDFLKSKGFSKPQDLRTPTTAQPAQSNANPTSNSMK